MAEAVGPGWRSGPLLVARSRRQRRRGLRPRPAGRGLLLRARSVHSFGMHEALGLVSLDGAGRVRRVGVLSPGGLFWDQGACWVIELPLSRPPPPVGVTLRLLAGRPLQTEAGGVCWHT